MQENKTEKLKGFTRHGFEFAGFSGNQAYGTCPFTGKQNKFYINLENLLWDSKVENISGNFFTFLEQIHKRNRANITKADLKRLSENRGIPVEAFKGFEIGYWDGEYSIPIRNEKGKIRDLRMYKIGEKLMSTPTCQVVILGIEKVATNKGRGIYLCEGEWDAIAMQWLLNKNNRKCIVLGVPGATTFKAEWAFNFKDREVIVFYDNDQAGEDGEHRVLSRIHNVAKSIKFTHWLEKFPKGFDVRDFVVLEAVKNNRPRRCLEKLFQMVKSHPRKEFTAHIDSASNGEPTKKPLPPIDPDMTWDKMLDIIKKWMKIEDLSPVLVASSVLISNYLEGDPIWLFLVAAPGEGKSEVLGTFRYCPECYVTSSITPNALISGAVNTKREPSLLPKLNGKTLCIKDFSTVQTMRDSDRESLLGILRDAYDGSAGKVFGTGESKYFESKFSMIAGSTPSIYELDFSALGERFLKFFMGSYLDHKEQIDVILQAMSNVGQETSMREEMAGAMYSFMENTKALMKSEAFKLPSVSSRTELRIAYLSAWCSRIKGTVARDKYEKDVILNKAYAEVGTRTGKQLKRMMTCFPTVIYRGHENDDDYNIIKKIALDTISAKREDVFRCIYLNCKTEDDSVSVQRIMEVTKYCYTTVNRIVDDLIALGILQRVGVRKPYQFKITAKMTEFTKKAGLYEDNVTKNRIYRSEYIEQNRELLKNKEKFDPTKN